MSSRLETRWHLSFWNGKELIKRYPGDLSPESSDCSSYCLFQRKRQNSFKRNEKKMTLWKKMRKTRLRKGGKWSRSQTGSHVGKAPRAWSVIALARASSVPAVSGVGYVEMSLSDSLSEVFNLAWDSLRHLGTSPRWLPYVCTTTLCTPERTFVIFEGGKGNESKTENNLSTK